MPPAKKATPPAEKPTADDTTTTAPAPPSDLDQALTRIAELEAQLAQTTAAKDEAEAAAPLLDIPADLPEGFVFNRITGQQWCAACATGPLDPSATGWTCEHGSWQADTQTYTPEA